MLFKKIQSNALCSLFYSDRVNPSNTNRPTWFLRLYISRHTAIRTERREDKVKKDCQIPEVLHAGNRLLKWLSLNHVLPFTRKEGWLQVGVWGPRRQNLRPQNTIPKPWNLMRFGSNTAFPIGFQNCFGLVTPFFL